MARSVMLQGTSSHVGKSVLAAALCRILGDRGLKVAPFKAQNMALNSFVTPGGGEIGRAQAFQAEAARVEPTVDMNPVLLKPTADSMAQVIIQGRIWANMSAVEYHAFKSRAREFVAESFSRLSEKYDVIVIEGAGSPAEVNLRENDIANMGVAELAGSPVVLVGDIDRGGVFASIVGTMELLAEGEKDRVRGFIINKFRGDLGLLRPGVDFLTRRTGVPTLGVIPYLNGMMLPDEDGVALESPGKVPRGDNGKVNIKVIRLPRISNFTDFDPLKAEPDVRLKFVENPDEIGKAAMVIIPGSKNTVEDLAWLKSKGFDAALRRFHSRGGSVIGICGGFQMLGVSVEDPLRVESSVSRMEGLGLLDGVTVLKREKKTFQVAAEAALAPGGPPVRVNGYEIHMGETKSKARSFARIFERNGTAVDIPDGAVSGDGLVWGTYIHGIFDNDAFRNEVIEGLEKGCSARVSYARVKEEGIAALSRTVEENMDMKALLGIIGI
ncbi:MAG TPA: cobyric acid synthase [Thermodesulfobacteriota bacterium]|nr:cobyric acid synthase [Thermodesulfobacteriota bacterium]